ncbi:Trk system potassium transporter TrkA [Halopiger xanaduensis]|uniref:TrkA-N domain protein n=1 Tax=Halopiger xanaduensis (strain DSM 18323 / JCM 14033 / SH-6) TaxID=797210 RepID=F8D3B7_HALXS|nr:Trk system potassium transporter TrkA [Halopiger xanaduensis]AEH38554.1 TrkA-N domain protein [Halopiger xanaduensis SH-6]
MRVIVVGAGEVGSSIAESLATEHGVVVIDRDEDRVESVTYAHDVLAIEGDGTSIEVLEEAGIERADLVIASTDGDETNIVVCGAAKAVTESFTIARVKRTNLLRTWERSQSAFGVDFMVSTDLYTAEEIVNIAGLPGAADVDAFADGLVQMAEFEVTSDSPVANETVSEADRFESLTFAAIIRGDEVIIPQGDTVIRPEDGVVVIGSSESVREFAGAVTPAPTLEDANEIVVIGGSEIGYQTARLFEVEGFEPRLLERDPERARELAEQLPDTVVLESDATDVEFLGREHIGEADIVVAALENDEKNLLVSLLARHAGAQRTIAVVEEPEYVDLFETVGIDVAINPRAVTAEEITRFTREFRTENVAMLESDRAEVLEIEIDDDSLLLENRISDVVRELPDGVVIGAITRDGRLITPRGDTVLERGDHVVVFADTRVLDEVAAAL